MFTKKLLFIFLLLVLPFTFPPTTFAQNIFADDFETGEISDKWPYITGTWSKENFSGSTWTRVSSGGSTDNEIELVNATWTDYIFKVDIFKIEGEDINLFFRTQDLRYLNLPGHNLPVAYGIHFQHNRIALQKFTQFSGTELQVITDNVPFLNSTLKHVEIRVLDNNIKVFIDNNINPVIDFTDDNEPFLTGGIGMGSITGSSGQNVRFDNVVVSELPTETATPSPSPSPSPSPTPSPSPSPSPSSSPTASANASATPIVTLNVPSLKQYSMPWKNKIYAFTKNTIHEFGCALTSAAMVLQYHGHNINPDKLNDWLKNQNDGYIRNGLINWLAVSRYTKIRDSINSPTLEYKRLLPTTENLINELNNGRPAILKENGHFIVAKSILPETFGINDPGYANRNDLTSYGNAFLAINSYTPTHSDLSYMMFVIEPQFDIKIYDNNNNLIPTDSFVEEPINSLLNQNKKSGSKLKIVTLQKPQNGNFVLKVTGPKGNYNLDSYLYDTNGKVSQENFDGRLNGNDTDRFDITFGNKKRIKEEEHKSDYRFWFKRFFDKYKYFRDHD